MSRYKFEIWPPAPTAGMQVPRMSAGIKVTDTETGRTAICTEHRSQYQNRDAAIAELRAMDDCTHRHIQSWQDEGGNPVDFWSCRECGRRFEPVADPGTEIGRQMVDREDAQDG